MARLTVAFGAALILIGVITYFATGQERMLVDFLMGELSSFTGEGWEQEDDITLLALRNSAASR